MTDYNNISCPCYGSLTEIHDALIGELNHGGQQCVINGYGYTVEATGFRSNKSGRIHDPTVFAATFPPDGLGVAILVGFSEIENDPGMEGNLLAEIWTSKKIPHVAKRCPECGRQLDQYEIKHYGACGSCYAEAVR